MSTIRRFAQSRLPIIVMMALMLSLVASPPASAQDAALAGTWYVATTGLDSNSCASPGAPCLTINAAIGKAAAGDTIKVAIGTYTGSDRKVVIIDRDLTLSGGWEAGFTTQSGMSIIDGQTTQQGIYTSYGYGLIATVDHFVIQNGFSDYGAGGGIDLEYSNTLTLTKVVVTHNSAGSGAGISTCGTLTINDSIISNNTAGTAGGTGGSGGAGIDSCGLATLTLNNTTVSGNKILGSYPGSAILAGTTADLNNVTISGNTGSYALVGYPGSHLNLNNTTVAYNSGGIGGGLTVSVRNSILAGNYTNGGADCAASISSLGYNIIGNSTGCTFTSSTGDQVGTAEAPINPRLGPLADHGGFSFTHALAWNSPALDAGNPAAPGSGVDACLATDQRGVARPVDSACDIGAYEGHVAMVESIAPADPNPTSANTVNYTVTFSEAVTGVETTAPFSDFALTASGVAGAAITGVSGSGSTYTVTANTGTGIGTLRLDLIDDDTILDASNIPLGGPTAGNGNFTSGQAYTMQKPVVSSVIRASLNPTSAASVHFTVTFSQSVTGVITVAPFSDFSLTTTGVTGASIKSVSGSGKTYTVTVGTGSGNGTIRLNVIDNDTIMDDRIIPLGGSGLGNGNFTTGQAYTIIKIPPPQFPTGAIWDTTPAYKWSRVPLATQYSYQLFKGTTLIYYKTMLASACGASACVSTPATQLVPGAYKWRVRAMLGGAWRNYSPYKTLTLYAPKAGYWSRAWTNFYVTASRVQVSKFSINISVRGCGNYKITKAVLLPISNTGTFSFTGAFSAYGTFSKTTLNPTSASGTATLSSYNIAGCGPVSGSAAWTANWINSSQPDAAQQDLGSFILVPTLNGPLGLLSTDSFTLDP